MQRWATVKDRNGMDLTEAGGKNTQNYTQKILNDPDNHNVVITHLEPYILNAKSSGS